MKRISLRTLGALLGFLLESRVNTCLTLLLTILVVQKGWWNVIEAFVGLMTLRLTIENSVARWRSERVDLFMQDNHDNKWVILLGAWTADTKVHADVIVPVRGEGMHQHYCTVLRSVLEAAQQSQGLPISLFVGSVPAGLAASVAQTLATNKIKFTLWHAPEGENLALPRPILGGRL